MSNPGHTVECITADWPAPPMVRAFATTRSAGVSAGRYATLNLGDHVGDDSAAVAANRAIVQQELGLTDAPRWLRQVHSARVVDAADTGCDAEADGSFTRRVGVVCGVLTADCLPVLLCDRHGSRVAALHAGWRGLAAGILESGVAALGCAPGHLLAWLGPAIGPRAYEVGPEVRDAFVAVDRAATSAFQASPGGRWRADLYALARLRLAASGVAAVYGGHWCTFTQADKFYSYRRDGLTGRMASLIWLASG